MKRQSSSTAGGTRPSSSKAKQSEAIGSPIGTRQRGSITREKSEALVRKDAEVAAVAAASAATGDASALLHQRARRNSTLEPNARVSYSPRRNGHKALKSYLRKELIKAEERVENQSEGSSSNLQDSLLVGPCEGDDDFCAVSVLKKFELVQKLGHSPWSVVWRAVDKKSRVPVALKKLYSALDNSAERARAAYREIRILEELQSGPNIVQLRHVLLDSDSKDGGDDVYLVLGLSSADLFDIIRANALEPKHYPYIMAQLLRALSFVHARGFVHRDVKPSNVLINSRCEVTLCDFGHARSLAGSEEPISHNNRSGTRFTDYLGSRWYRAPESLLGASKISPAVDIWGAGCVLGEMLLGHPVLEGTSTSHQLRLILEVTGYPDAKEMESTLAPFTKEQLALDVIGSIQPKAISQVFPNATAEALDFVRLCLQFSPVTRFSAKSAIKHPFVIEYFHECIELTNEITEKAKPFFLDDNVLCTVAEYKHCITENAAEREKKLRRLHGQSGRFGYSLGFPT